MLASQLIKKLQELVDKEGDLEVFSLDANEWRETYWEEPKPHVTEATWPDWMEREDRKAIVL